MLVYLDKFVCCYRVLMSSSFIFEFSGLNMSDYFVGRFEENAFS